ALGKGGSSSRERKRKRERGGDWGKPMNGGGGGGADVGWLLIRGVQAAAVHAKSPIGMSTTNCFELQVGGYNCTPLHHKAHG
ncbi:unnamed protein product, partial [Musa textilis]